VKRSPNQVRGAVVDLVVSKNCDINKINMFLVPKYDLSNVCIQFMFHSNI
jgi:hypothetical protein